jgi:hypothetical protein
MDKTAQQLEKQVTVPPRQRGAVLVLFMAGLIAILAVAGLALDGSHQMLNKTRLQNAVDASALAAARVLDQTNDTDAARTEALRMFADNADDAGNREMNNRAGSITVAVEFSQTVNPFAPGTSPPEYVRVRATGFTMPAWLTQVIGIDTKTVAASAVSGPSPTIVNACKLVPLIICGDEAAGAPNYGYEDDQLVALKSGSQGDGPDDIGPGNYQWAALGASGADAQRDALAGGYEGDCIGPGTQVPTEPGNMAGPARDAIGTRFNIFKGTMKGTEDKFPSDVITDQPEPPLKFDPDNSSITQAGNPVSPLTEASQIDFNYDDYTAALEAGQYDVPPESAGGKGRSGRRILPVVIAKCDGLANGRSEVEALGVGCFFLLQEMPTSSTGKESYIFGEFVESCNANGTAGPEPTVIPGPYLIQLYKDSGSHDS